MTELETAWLAGLLEGEGSFSKYTKGTRPRVSVAMVDQDVVETAARLMNARKVRTYQCKMPNSKPMFGFEISGPKAEAIMQLVLPFMHSRRKQRIEELLALWRQ